MIDWRQGHLLLLLVDARNLPWMARVKCCYIHACTCKRPKAGDPSLLGVYGSTPRFGLCDEPSWYEDNSHGVLAAEA